MGPSSQTIWGVWIGRTLYSLFETKAEAIAFAIELRALVPERCEEMTVRLADAAEIQARGAKKPDA